MPASKVCGEAPNHEHLCSLGRMLVEAAEHAHATAQSKLANHLLEVAMLAFEEELRELPSNHVIGNQLGDQMICVGEGVLE